MLVKLIPRVNSINILLAALAPIYYFAKKIRSQAVIREKPRNLAKLFCMKKAHINMLVKLTPGRLSESL